MRFPRSDGRLLSFCVVLLLLGCAPSIDTVSTDDVSSTRPASSDSGVPAAEPPPATLDNSSDSPDGSATPLPAQVGPVAPPNEIPPKTPDVTPPPELVSDVCDGRSALTEAVQDIATIDSLPHRRAAAAIHCDAYEIASRISSLRLPAEVIHALNDRITELRDATLAKIEARPIESSRLPLSSSHEQMYALLAEAERTAGAPALRAWVAGPWEPFAPVDQPTGAAAVGGLSTALMRGERRVVAINMRSVAASVRTLRVQVLLRDFPLDALRIYRVNWTGNDRSSWAAAELEPLGDASSARQIALVPGISQQLWIQVNPSRTSEPGRFVGSVTLSFEGTITRIPLDVTVFHTVFPARPTLHLAGWDYADGGADARYAVNDSNRAQFIEYLSSRYVDMPWGHRRVMHWYDLGDDGELRRPLGASAMRNWLSEWPAARRFRVYLHTNSGIAGILPTDERFPHAVATWAQTWAQELRRLNKQPEQFDLSLLDEPQTTDKARTIELWAHAIRQSGIGFRIWTDPVWADPLHTPTGLIDAVDKVAINLRLAETSGQVYWDWARSLAQRGKTIEIYACEGPARRLDPYAYYRLTAWRGFFLGAAAVSFWSFAYTGESPSDNEFAAGIDATYAYNYSPLFVNGDQVRPGKHMEAAAEGIQDAEYLRMLRQVATEHDDEGVRQRAGGLLAAAEHFLATSPPSSLALWRLQAESDEADRQRIEIGLFLDSAL